MHQPLGNLLGFIIFTQFHFFLNFLMFIYFLRDRERQTMSRGGQREGDTEPKAGCRLQALSCQHWTRCGAQTHEPWDRDLSRSQLLNPGAPTRFHFFIVGKKQCYGEIFGFEFSKFMTMAFLVSWKRVLRLRLVTMVYIVFSWHSCGVIAWETQCFAI